MGSIYSRNIRRTIFGSMGRYIAILSIIALGVGFFAGVKNTKASMIETCNEYTNALNMYDYRLVSTYGFTSEDEEYFAGLDKVSEAEGAYSADFFSEDRNGDAITLRAHSITKDLNGLSLVEGRMPENDDECVVDSVAYGKDDIGKTVRITDENTDDVKDILRYDGYKIVGIVDSPYYLMKEERGTTSLGDGTINAFVYIPAGGFDSEYFTEMFLTCKEQGYVFTDEYDKNIKAAEDEITEAAELRSAERVDDIRADAQEQIDEGQREIDEGRAELERERDKAYAELSDAKSTLESSSEELAAGKAELASQKSSLTSQREQTASALSTVKAAIEAASKPGSVVSEEELAALEKQARQLRGAISAIDAGLDEISAQEKRIADGEAELEKGYDEYYSGKKTADREFSAAEKKLEDGEAELADAREELSEIEDAEIYVYTREDNIGYDSFDSNSDIVDNIAKVFPVFFFLIAALVCSTTMTRMIEEERPQIGAFRALGYTRGRIMLKYMVYSGSAAIIGCIIGFLAGSRFFPYAIWIAYGMMFGFAPLEYYFDWQLAVISLVVSLLCSMGTTYLACRGQLKDMPAEILRPKAPKAGKRIFLEKIDFIWTRLSFLHKVTARNVFRYKKRMFMMILGIGGCTALVMAGFGLHDSVAGIANHQYGEIEKYSMLTVSSERMDGDREDELEEMYGDDISNIAVLEEISVTLEGKDADKSCTLMITGDDDMTKAVEFRTVDGERIAYPGTGEAVINNKLADMAGAETGDTITVGYDDTKTTTLKVSGIYKNYVSNYIFINEDTYAEDFGKEYEPTMAFITVADDVDVYDMSERLYENEDIIGISVNEDTKKRVDDMMVSLNYIIILVIGCAGALAFIVLFNLGNINITERVREIATIEVLGFYPRETGSYVFRENFLLVLMGIAVGLPAGFFLHHFIMSQIKVDAVSFNNVIEPTSYLFTVLVVLGFALIVDVIMRRKLRRINMAEALKSIE